MKLETLISNCNYYLSCQYPNGVCVVGSDQHRDLIRTFFAGVYDGLILIANEYAVKQAADLGLELLPFYEQLCKPGWKPDARFDYVATHLRKN